MFGRVINKIFKRGSLSAKPATGTDETAASEASPFARNNAPSKTAQSESARSNKKQKAGKTAAPTAAEAVKEKWAAKAGERLNAKESPEVLCGINKQMSKEEISQKLAELYRRHNRAASSLDPQMREDSEIMLEAIASAKEKFLLKK